METTDHAKHLSTDEGKSFWVAGDLLTIKLAGEATKGAFTLLEEITPPQGGPPRHIHLQEDETFYVLEGDLEFMVDERAIRAGAESVVYGPRGIPHTFKNVGETPSRLLVLITPAGFEKFFEDVGEPATDKSSPPPFGQEEIERILATAPKYDHEILPPSG